MGERGEIGEVRWVLYFTDLRRKKVYWCCLSKSTKLFIAGAPPISAWLEKSPPGLPEDMTAFLAKSPSKSPCETGY
ncbi:hypothetical protein AAC387_Pa03g3507 [Persea americana]